MKDLFESHTSLRQYMHGSHSSCSSCKTHPRSYNLNRYNRIPPIAVFHINRSLFGKNVMSRVKVALPLRLSISTVGKYNIMTEGDEGDRLDYELRATSNHIGLMSAGHYVAYGKRGGKWYKFNDTLVTEVSGPSEESATVCSCFYELVSDGCEGNNQS